MKDKSAPRGAVRGPVGVSGPSATPWLNILKKCLLVAAAATAALAVAALIVTGWLGAGSVAFGSVVVVAFFGLSLLVGHLFSKRMPKAVMGIFMMTYIVKVLGFGAVLLALGTPTWLNKPWFAGAAVVSVLLWQATEVITFSRQRLQLFNDPADPQSTVNPPRGRS